MSEPRVINLPLVEEILRFCEECRPSTYEQWRAHEKLKIGRMIAEATSDSFQPCGHHLSDVAGKVTKFCRHCALQARVEGLTAKGKEQEATIQALQLEVSRLHQQLVDAHRQMMNFDAQRKKGATK